MKSSRVLAGLAVLVCATFAMGNGWECKQKDGTHAVDVYNATHAIRGVKNPVVFKVYHGDDLELWRGFRTITMESGPTQFAPNQVGINMNKIYRVGHVEESELATIHARHQNVHGVELVINGDQDQPADNTRLTTGNPKKRSARLWKLDDRGRRIGNNALFELWCSYYKKSVRVAELTAQQARANVQAD